MGAGKSTIGRQLAARLHIPFVDLDEAIVARAGKSIPKIFEEDGECIFRSLEGETLAALCTDGQSRVLATGGGVVMSAPNRRRMKKAGPVIWLDASVETLASRISGDDNRPLLRGADPLQKTRELSRARSPYYEQCADLTVDTEMLDVDQAVDAIMGFVKRWKREKAPGNG